MEIVKEKRERERESTLWYIDVVKIDLLHSYMLKGIPISRSLTQSKHVGGAL